MLVINHGIAFLGLLETKKESIDLFMVRRLWPNLDFDILFVSSVGASGGLLWVLNTVSINVTSILTGNRWICSDFVWEGMNYRHILIYASSVIADRITFWNDILQLVVFNGSVDISGDFNEILIPEERTNSSGYTSSIMKGSSLTYLSKEEQWPSMSLTALSKGLSDHSPILFKFGNEVDWGPKPFRSIDAWWKHDNFSEFAANSRLKAGESHTTLVPKLKDLRNRLKDWNQQVFADSRARTESEIETLASLRTEFLIAAVQNGNERFTDLEAMKFSIRQFFSSLFERHHKADYMLSNLCFSKLSPAQSEHLLRAFSEAEILSCVNSINQLKAPGPDDFNFFFYKRAWSFSKQDILNFFSTFHETTFLPKGINTSFSVLIPKVTGSANLSDYRPIGFVNGIYKLLSKVLSMRLAPMLPDIISDYQHAFIKGGVFLIVL
ncbi:uncharacterized protein LOC126681874 [Mercurialis annua]|uniref:uncharacterized protein LOC126681874 n=1 Tax=Mercurialis annua TaxID=3986 RepID=UPI00215F4D5F|nr:uncharacterized protein LOC126681874 [Mercurialis annua]